MKESVCSSCSSLYWGLFENGFRRAEKGAECELEDYPGQRFTTVSRLQQSAEWQVQALDLTPYYKEGDGVVIVASVPKSENSAAVQDTDDTEADSEASTAGESGQRLMPVLPVPAELRITPSIKPTWLRWARTAAHLGDTGVFTPVKDSGRCAAQSHGASVEGRRARPPCMLVPRGRRYSGLGSETRAYQGGYGRRRLAQHRL
jgi:hypothetical protein